MDREAIRGLLQDQPDLIGADTIDQLRARARLPKREAASSGDAAAPADQEGRPPKRRATVMLTARKGGAPVAPEGSWVRKDDLNAEKQRVTLTPVENSSEQKWLATIIGQPKDFDAGWLDDNRVPLPA